MSTAEAPFSVSQLTRRIKALLEDNLHRVVVQGEVSSLARPSSGHQYFTLKDEAAQISAAMFKGSAAKLKFQLEEGLEVICHGRISLYEPRGSYQLIVEKVEPVGEGALQLAFEQMKERLSKEGLFALENKIPIPKFPSKIGIITSPTGAAVQDMVNILGRRCPSVPILIAPSLVQGETAAQMLAFQVENLDQRPDIDLIIIGRGGGSLEDLWAFNEELLVRAVAQCQTPIISAVGHETDFTLCDFAADLRAATPSAAAELAVPMQSELLQQIERAQKKAQALVQTWLAQQQTKLKLLTKALRDPAWVIQAQAQRVDEAQMRLKAALLKKLNEQHNRAQRLEFRLRQQSPELRLSRLAGQNEALEARLQSAMKQNLDKQQSKLGLLAGQLNSLSPLAVLQRGYSLTQNLEGKLITEVGELSLGQGINVRLQDGQVRAKVEHLQKDS